MAFLNIFRGSSQSHPLADPKAAERALAGLTGVEPEAAVTEICTWLESLLEAEGINPQRKFELTIALDTAGIGQVRRYIRTYLGASRNRSQEFRLWQLGTSYWRHLAIAYKWHLVTRENVKTLAGVPKSERALFFARLLNAYGGLLKWDQFRYGPVDEKLWHRAGSAYLMAEQQGLGSQVLRIYPNGAETTISREYLRLLVFQALSMGCLLPTEIELAERLIDRFLPLLSLTTQSGPESVFWVDAAKPQPPRRLVRMPKPTPTTRYFGTGQAYQSVEALRLQIDLTGEVPPELALGGQYPAELLVKVLTHLAQGCAPVPPQRSFPRLPVKTRVAVVFGLEEIRHRLDGASFGQDEETWIAEDVSRGGMGAQVALSGQDGIRVGALLGFRPEGGENWLVGVIRRFIRNTQTSGAVGIETLSMSARLGIMERGPATLSVLVLDPTVAVGEEIRIATAHNEWEPYATSILEVGGDEVKVRPLEAIEQGPGYVVGRYRVEPVRYMSETSGE